ncbi:hypothetical protein A1O3_08230 [Capronia epimyces CBS 606.96]|uniref:NB-ARC domain-containing protein n=1 Tax=Capronia epimyces CBS 606.96 TaxID=1182542 RepID=W9YC88_9EURO|nr:uncharacterized protein A1O3_08230 [Capronia epimyces CBS 606.96]EXJ79944.1 hypothetical protein A1O3_08230 [Capronia epimyces CBS 606.96]
MDVKETVRAHLSQDTAGEWLLILDNADDMTLWGRNSPTTPGVTPLTKYLPKSPSGSILVTTRSRRVAAPIAGKHVINLMEVTAEEAEQMLKSLLPESSLADREETELLLEKLTYLPLAIVQAASYINENDASINDYLELLDSTQEDGVIALLSENFDDHGRYAIATNPIAATWLISFEQIRKAHALAADYLAFMACLGEKNIPRLLLPSDHEEKDILEAIGTLKGYSFLRQQGNENSPQSLYDMHRLVRLATRNWLKKENSLSKSTEIAIRQTAHAVPYVHWETKDTWLLCMPHAQTLRDSGFGENLAERYELLLKVGICFDWTGKPTEAVEIFGR